ncbi:MAG: type VI secretion system-associated FHA domain protein TagH [Azoarcus sp.]|jgi:type VI secretion system FHA domain protein|nr:type VI secretion system-associated FHA domain protein TagH [Azoarcus sp.]
MLEIRALTYNDLPPVLPIVGTISGSGVTIGRGGGNAIALPDPVSLISRQHLRLDLEANGTYRVSNISDGNMAFVNDDELESGASRPLRDQDRLSLGGYVLQVRYMAQAQVSIAAGTPGDDFLAALAADAASPTPAASLPEDADPLGTLMYGTTADRRDLMQALNERGVELRSLDSKGDELLRGENIGNMARELVSDPLSGTATGGHLTRDTSLDPLEIFGEGTESGGAFDDILQSGKSSDTGAAMHMDLTHGSELGSLFSLPTLSGQSPASPPPAAGTSASPPPGGAGLIGDLEGIDDLLGSPPSPPAPPPAVAGNAPPQPGGAGLIGDLEGIDDLLAPPPSSPPSPPPPAAAESAPPPPSDAGIIADLGGIDDLIAGLAPAGRPDAPMPSNVALPDNGRTARAAPPTVSEPARAAANRTAPPAPASQPATLPTPQAVVPQPASGTASQPAPTPAKAAASPDAEALYKAFIEGLGIDLPGRAVLDKTFMKMLGRMMRNYTEGTVDLIASRAIVKQDVRANVTLIAPERNNPLKFSSDGNVALLYLLGKPFPGFMEPVEAVRSTFADLRTHQIELVSDMRSAFSHVLQCFDPALIGNGDPARGLLDQAMPSRRKARLWDTYERYFSETQASVTHRFQSFFGAAFVKAYEDAMAALQSGKETGKP